ncbi:MAG: type II toxin-antitoxin system VapC family toxin [Acidobacteria bacterium]|nr:type II toxin-antitoxin system VapC family toxin [Acidobacteriota bacterium]
MNLVDSSGWLEYFANGRNAGFFAPALEDVGRLIVPSISILEVFKRVLQQRGEREALQAAAMMRVAQVVDLDATLALLAARLSFDLKLPLADSVILATARAHGATVWTQDRDFKGLAGVKYVTKK